MRTCRKCGCTEEAACVTEGVPCHWVQEDLCSACASSQLCLQTEDLAALQIVQPISIELDGPQAMLLLSALQLSLRHPQFAGEAAVARNFVSAIAKALAEYTSLTPNLKALAEEGFRQNEEPQKHSGLVLPPSYGQ